MNVFTASNGVELRLNEDGFSDEYLDFRSNGPTWLGMCGGKVVQALREFFQAEADERLGRWRWPADPEFVVYPEGEMVCVTNERTGHGNVFGRQWYEDHKSGLLAKEQPGVYAAAGAYFDAHPEPKPWHEAKPGEVWVARIAGEDRPFLVDETQFTDGNEGWYFDDAEIEDAHRIWPVTL